MQIRICCFWLVALLVACSPAAYATEAEPSLSKNEVKSLLSILEEQKRQLREQQRKLDALEKKVSDLTRKSDTGKATPTKAEGKSGGLKYSKAEGDTAPGEVGLERKPEESDKPPEIAADLDEGGVLLQKGKLVLTPAFEYTRSSATLVSIEGFSVIPAINIGSFQVTRVGRDILTESIAARLGVTNRFEIEGKIPYVYRRDATTGRPVGGGATDTTSRLSSMGLGDVEVGAHYQINDGKGGWPFFISNMRFKSITGEGPFEIPTDANGNLTRLPTGTGFYAIQPSVTAIYPSDPIVYYANLGYLYNVSRNFSGIGNVEPGDSISAAFGMSMSFNDRASFSIGYSHSSVFETLVNDTSLNGDMLQVGSLDFGYAYQLDDRYSLNLNVSAGITDDAPDARIGVRVPIKFSLY